MLSKRHTFFNIVVVLLPWLSVLFMGKRNIKRFYPAGIFIVLCELVFQVIGQSRKWWVFYDKPKSFTKDMLPFSFGPYMPMSMWMLRLSYGHFIKFLSLNAVADALFAFPGILILNKIKVANLHRLSKPQFFLYLFSKVPLLYAFQYLFEKKTKEL
ncbi:hypothetical protein [Niallia taxi]|uniref:hypothetical protein n=1 Tax=Niallia taxi TaxID=2499688 RepID=UPI0015F592F1|nr:hypothetical protein [Niallia taxi]